MAIVFEQALDVGEPKRPFIFDAIAESGDICAAARDLGWSQPALSRHMNALGKGSWGQSSVQGSDQVKSGKSTAGEGQVPECC